MKNEKRLAKIVDTWLGFEDHGCFTFCLMLDYGDSSQGFGHYGIKNPQCAEALMGILNACSVDQWEKLKGRTVFALIEQGMVRGIEPLPTETGERFHVDDIWPRD